jgi:hypothetical protein
LRSPIRADLDRAHRDWFVSLHEPRCSKVHRGRPPFPDRRQAVWHSTATQQGKKPYVLTNFGCYADLISGIVFGVRCRGPLCRYGFGRNTFIASLSHFPRQVGVAWESLQDCTLRVVIRSGIGTPSLARPKLLSSFRFLLRSGGSRSAPTVTLLLLAFVSHSQQVALVLTGVNVSEPIYTWR